MAFRSKAYKDGAAKIEEGRFYSPLDAVRLAQKTNPAKFDASVEVAMRPVSYTHLRAHET